MNLSKEYFRRIIADLTTKVTVELNIEEIERGPWWMVQQVGIFSHR
jgi:hypothetical protein